jgi:hypothetical protein
MVVFVVFLLNKVLTLISNCDIVEIYETEPYKQITTKTYR